MADAEHLATRAYELGQSTLPTLVVARRETATGRVAHLDARIALARARVALDVAAGVLP
jgi:outer membrane protein TolC